MTQQLPIPPDNDTLARKITRLADSFELVVANGAKSRLKEHARPDQFEAFASLRNLEDGGCADYGLPAIGPAYSLLYHGRRVHDAVYFLAASLCDLLKHSNQTSKVELGRCHLVDFGCGTGAVLWALLLLRAIKHECVASVNQVAYYGIDTSDRMLAEAEALWSDLLNGRPSHWLDVKWMSRLEASPPGKNTVVVSGYSLENTLRSSTFSGKGTTASTLAIETGAAALIEWTSEGKAAEQLTAERNSLVSAGWTAVRSSSRGVSKAPHGFWPHAAGELCRRAVYPLYKDNPRVHELPAEKKFFWKAHQPTTLPLIAVSAR